jgi:hypothetical protein
MLYVVVYVYFFPLLLRCFFDNENGVDTSGQLHVPDTLPPGKSASLSILERRLGADEKR